MASTQRRGTECGKARTWRRLKEMGYSRMFFSNSVGDYELTRDLHNAEIDLLAEAMDRYDLIGVQMGLNGEISA